MKNKLSIYLKLIICIVLIIVFSNGFNQGQEVDDFAYVIALGIDTGKENNIQVSLQFAKAVNTSEGGSSDPQPSFIYTVEASSLSSAINLLNSYMSKRINLAHCKVVVFSEDFAQNGISEELYTLFNNIQIRPDVSIIVSKCSSRYFIEKSKPSLEIIVTKYYEISPQSEEYTGYTSNVKIIDFFNALNCSTCEPYAILGGVNTKSQKLKANSLSNFEKDSEITAGETALNEDSGSETIGLAVFKGDKLVGETTAIDTLMHLIVTNKLKSANLTIPNPYNQNSTIDLLISKDRKTKCDVKFINNSPYITIDANISARILSVSGNSESLDDKNIETIEKQINSYLENKLYDYLYKTSLDFNSDVCGFGKFAIGHFLTTDEWNNYNWLNNYKNSIFKVNVNSSIKSGLLLTQD